MSNSFFEIITREKETVEPTSSPELESESLNEPEEDDEMVEGLSEETRRVLVYLLRQGVILASQKPKLFKELCHYQEAIRHYLSQIYLYLILDELNGVAFVATNDQASCDENGEEEEEILSLITRRTLSLPDTLLILVLCKHYRERKDYGEQKVVIDIERIESNLTPFQPLTDHGSLERKKLSGRLKEMIKRKILAPIRGSEDRFEITPIIRYIIGTEFLESMLAEYLRLAKESGLRKDSEQDNNSKETE